MLKKFLFTASFLFFLIANALACEVTFEAIAEKYDLRDELFDDYLGIYWPGYELKDNQGSVRIKGVRHQVVHVIDGEVKLRSRHFVRLLYDGKRLLVNKSTISDRDRQAFVKLKFISEPKNKEKYRIETPKIINVQKSIWFKAKNNFSTEFVPGGSLTNIFYLARKGILSEKQFLEAMEKLVGFNQRIKEIEFDQGFIDWSQEIEILPMIDTLGSIFPLDLYREYLETGNYRLGLRKSENMRYFRGQWYLIDP